MKKVTLIFTLAVIAAMTAAAQTPTADPGVTINGVTWATRNVAEPGTFAETPESAGMFYHFNDKQSFYNATDPGRPANLKRERSTGAEWAAENDPSPAGWRVPSPNEIKSLFDAQKVTMERDSERKGMVFTDKATGNSVFFAFAGYRNGGFLTSANKSGLYWGNRQADNPLHAYAVSISDNPYASMDMLYTFPKDYALPVRPVKADGAAAQTGKRKDKELPIGGAEKPMPTVTLAETTPQPQTGTTVTEIDCPDCPPCPRTPAQTAGIAKRDPNCPPCPDCPPVEKPVKEEPKINPPANPRPVNRYNPPRQTECIPCPPCDTTGNGMRNLKAGVNYCQPCAEDCPPVTVPDSIAACPLELPQGETSPLTEGIFVIDYLCIAMDDGQHIEGTTADMENQPFFKEASRDMQNIFRTAAASEMAVDNGKWFLLLDGGKYPPREKWEEYTQDGKVITLYQKVAGLAEWTVYYIDGKIYQIERAEGFEMLVIRKRKDK